MSIKKLKISNESIDTVLCKDYKEAILEYVWNGFDAGASTIIINTKENGLGGLDYIEILDNGGGICYENIENTFGSFLISQKKINKKWNNIHGSKGKGRFSFSTFAYSSEWNTIYELEGIKYSYKIGIKADDKSIFEITDVKKVENTDAGTKVIFTGVHSLSKENIESYAFKKFLINKFSWFLYLNKDKSYKIIINEEELDYSEIIDKDISESVDICIDNNKFDVHFIKWNGKIHEKYYYYYLDSKSEGKYRQCTSYNKDSIYFPHSVFVVSSYFEDFEQTPNDMENSLLKETVKNQNDRIFIDLNKELKKIVEIKRKTFIKKEAPMIIDKFKNEGAFPKFRENKYEKERKKDLEDVVAEIYAIQPKIFNRCNIEQKKSIIGFLNLLLDTDERLNIINIMDGISALTLEERQDLSNILAKTNFSRIIRTIKLIESRYEVIEKLKKLVYELNMFTNERDHIQKIIEENYWLFGEQYNLVTADKNFEKLLKSYLHVMDENSNEDDYEINNVDRLRRPDIFICRSRSLEMPNSIQAEENIIIELKEPKVILNKKVYRQVEDYMDLIMNEKKFNSGLRKWKFILVSTSVDDFIKGLYKSSEEKGRPFLVRWADKFEIYAMTWDDVFKSFEIKHRYLLDKLNIDKSIIQDELEARGISLSREGSNELTNQILELQTS